MAELFWKILRCGRPKHEHKDGEHDKAIGFWGSVCLLANNITGPGMVAIPGLYQQAGWVIPTAAFLWFSLQAGLTSLFLSKAITQVPGNKDLRMSFEFSNLAKALFPKWLYLTVFFALLFNFQITNISSIIVSAQTMDNTLLYGLGKTCALVVYNPDEGTQSANDTMHTFAGGAGFTCLDRDLDRSATDSAFNSAYVVSLGYIITLALTVPLGLSDIDGNIGVQFAGFALLVLCIVAWVYQALGVSTVTPSAMPAFSSGGMGAVLSNVVFNLGFLTTLPSWLNEKGPNVSVAKSTWTAIGISAVMFLALGFACSLGLNFPGGEDLLSALNDDRHNPGITLFARVCTFIFPSAALLSGIPIVCIIVRQNLLENRMCNKLWANIFAMALPWILALAFFAGNALNELITWSSAILFCMLNFWLPVQLYVSLNSPEGQSKMLAHLRSEGLLNEDALKGAAAGAVEAGAVGSLNVGAHAASGAGSSSGSAGGVLGTLRRLAGGPSLPSEPSFAADSDVASAPLLASAPSLVAPGLLTDASAAGSAASAALAEADPSHFDFGGDERIEELPRWWPHCCGTRSMAVTARVWVWLSVALSVACFALQVWQAATPSSGGGGDDDDDSSS